MIQVFYSFAMIMKFNIISLFNYNLHIFQIEFNKLRDWSHNYKFQWKLNNNNKKIYIYK